MYDNQYNSDDMPILNYLVETVHGLQPVSAAAEELGVEVSDDDFDFAQEQ